MHEPLTAEDLATFARLAKTAMERPRDTGHGQACGCEDCAAVWRGAGAMQDARGRLAELDAVGRLLAEVERVRARDAELLGALRACAAHDANPHSSQPRVDDLAARLTSLGVTAGGLERDGARHVAEVLLDVIERQGETMQRMGKVVGQNWKDLTALRAEVELDRQAAREVLDAAERGTAAETQMALGNLRHRAASWSRGPVVTVADQALAQEVARLNAENERLKEALAISERDANALMDRLAEPAPSDKAAAERSVCVDQERGGKAVSLQSTPDNFIVLARGLGDHDADVIAGSMQNILEGILSDHVAQLRAGQAADRAAVRALVEALPECSWYDGQNGCSTRSLWDGWGWARCHEHMEEPDAARDALRALQARMATWGEAATDPAASDADLSAHDYDVAKIRQALDPDSEVPVENAIDWAAFWQRRARLGKAAEAIEEPVAATVEWMAQEREDRHG
ncbi:hypothetical protein WMF30_10195 [Sorangium sp. So ce134]